MDGFLHIRGASRTDVNDLIDMDVKSFDNSWTAEEWSKLGYDTECALSVATMFGTPVGFMVVRHAGNSVELMKLAVKPHYRRRGISKQLMAACVQYARYKDAEHITCTVPEHRLYPGDGCLTPWLVYMGFKVTVPFIPNMFHLYGEYESGAKCIATLKEANEQND